MYRTHKRALALGGALIAATLVLGSGFSPRSAEARYVRNATRTNVNANVNRNRNVNVNRNYNVHRDVDVDVDHGHYHPVARGVAFGAAATLTAAAVGSVVNSLPPSCSTTMVNGLTYQNCGGTWYQPRYAGTQVNYVVVNPPR
jgi:hypothetical protein